MCSIVMYFNESIVVKYVDFFSVFSFVLACWYLVCVLCSHDGSKTRSLVLYHIKTMLTLWPYCSTVQYTHYIHLLAVELQCIHISVKNVQSYNPTKNSNIAYSALITFIWFTHYSLSLSFPLLLHSVRYQSILLIPRIHWKRIFVCTCYSFSRNDKKTCTK